MHCTLSQTLSGLAGPTSHVLIIHGLHHQLRVLDTVYDAKKSPCQAQQFTEAVEAKVDEVVGKTDNLERCRFNTGEETKLDD